jgi:ADP-ribosylation factor-binding protein GGA
MLTAHLANNRNPHIAMLALTLLDTLVQSCGYPFHLQISTKEFLNELVRRFPERPPPFPNPVMTRILELIHGWKEGICSQSRWKDDLGNIRDMHRLLTFKGYRFRDLPRQHQQDTIASATVRRTESLNTYSPFIVDPRTLKQPKNSRARIVKLSLPNSKNSSVVERRAIWQLHRNS